ncbi:MAG: biotin/lipoyl-binding protein [Aquabacterium sp.]|jgi:putative peptide zinc metalloprotease protein|nr:MAG: biotin/lipoyl-binding protein [Aquabacterium sp.]
MSDWFSAHWFRVAGLKPRLADGVLVQRQRVRGEVWQVLGPAGPDAATRSCRLNRAAYALAARLDGSRSVQAVWEELQRQEADDAVPTQEEVVRTLLALHAQGLLAYDRAPDFGVIAAQQAAGAPAAPRRARFNPLSWRLPLGDPTRVLDRLVPLAPRLFGRVAWWLWLVVVCVGAAAAALHADQLQAHARQWLSTPRYLLLAALLVPAMKALHELGHALAVRRHGGAVHEAGVTLMLLLPMPYVDASAASGFARVRHRVLVSAAGMLVELALAACGLALFLGTDAGWLHDIGFVVFFVGGVSSIVFNANPLQRFDGYYLLCDALQLPNLATRSRAFWLERLRERVLRVPPDVPLQAARGERPWLWAYAPLSWAWQAALAGLVAGWAGGLSSVLGVLAGAWLAWALLSPPLRLLAELWRAAWAPQRPGPLLARVALLAALPLLLLALPLPERALVRGVVWADEAALLRPQTEGFVLAVHASDGQQVQAGDLLLELSNPKLQAERDRVAAQADAAEHQQFQAFGEDGARMGNASEETQRLRAQLDELDRRLAGLQLRAARSGRLVLPGQADLDGAWLARGSLVGHVLGAGLPTLRVAVDHEDAVRLRQRLHGISVRPAGFPAAAAALPAQLLRDGQSATRQLPSAALGDRHGGDIQTDPQDRDALRTLRPVVLMDVAAQQPFAQRLGERAWVRFDLGWSPLAAQLLQGLRRQVAQRFNPAQ